MEVHATAVTAVAIEVAIAAAITALGIGVAGTVSNQDYSQMIEKIKTNSVEQAYANCTAAIVAGKTVVNMTHEFLWTVGTQFMLLYNAILPPPSDLPNGNELISNILEPEELISFFGLSGLTVDSSFYLGNISKVTVVSTVIPAIGNSVTQYSQNSALEFVGFNTDEESYTMNFIDTSTNAVYMTKHYTNAFPRLYLLNYLKGQNTYAGFLLKFSGATSLGYFHDDALLTGQDEFNVARDKFYADGLSALNNTLSDVLDKMRDRLGLGTDVDVPVSVPSDKVDDQLRDVTQDDVLGKDIATEDDKAKDEDTNKDKDTTPPRPPKLPDLTLPEIIFKEKFPFCLPWDLYLAFSNLAAPAEPPKWEIPFEIKSLNLKQDITIDFSQFNILAAVLRWGLSVAFVIWLVLLTRKIIGQ